MPTGSAAARHTAIRPLAPDRNSAIAVTSRAAISGGAAKISATSSANPAARPSAATSKLKRASTGSMPSSSEARTGTAR